MTEQCTSDVNQIVSILKKTQINGADSESMSTPDVDKITQIPRKRTRTRTYSTKLELRDLIKAGGSRKAHRPPSPQRDLRLSLNGLIPSKKSRFKRDSQTKRTTKLKRNILDSRCLKQQEDEEEARFNDPSVDANHPDGDQSEVNVFLERSCSIHSRNFAR